MLFFKRRTQTYTPSATTSENAHSAILAAVANRTITARMVLPHLPTLVEVLQRSNTTQSDAKKNADLFFRLSWGAIPAGSAAMQFAEQVYEALGRSHEIPCSWKNN